MIHIRTDEDALPEGISLERLKSLCLVVDHRGVSGAVEAERKRGRTVEATQLHRQIRDLEGAFGPLFERHGRVNNRMALDSDGRPVCTPTGARLVALARITWKGLQDIAHEKTNSVLALRLAAGDSFLQWLAIPKLGRALASERVALSLKAMSLGEAAAAVRSGEVDFAVTDRKTLSGLIRGRAELVTRDLGELGYSLFVPKGLRPAGARETATDVLRRVPLAHQHSEGAVSDRVREIQRPVAGGLGGFDCETFTQAAKAVFAGTHAAVLPNIARTELPRTRFEELEVPELGGLEKTMCLVWKPAEAEVSPRMRTTTEILAKALRLPV